MNNSQNEQKIIKEEKKIIHEEKEIIKEIKQEEKAVKNLAKRVWILTGIIAAIIVGSASGLAYLKISQSRIYTENADIEAPQINLAATNPGTLEELYVNAGDSVNADTVVARVGTELIKTKVGGIITSINNNIGKIFNPGETVASMLNPADLRVVGQIEEDKGLSEISVGQQAIFTADAFGSKQYQGVVDEISPTSREGDVVFNISGKRQIAEFNVYVRFDTDTYPELKNGMSAKLWIYK